MSDNSSISFEFANKFGYTGLKNDQIKPEYHNFKLDYFKLLEFLNNDGIVEYNPTLFKSEKIALTGSFTRDLFFDHYVDIKPIVLISNKEANLSIEAKLNKKVGRINLDRAYPFSLELNPEDSLERYTLKIPYAEVENPTNDGDFAIVFYSNNFDHIVYLIEEIKHLFTDKLEDWLFKTIENKFNSADIKNNRDRLDFMYEQIPLWIIARRDNEAVFQDLITIITGSVNSYGTDEELSVLRIIRSFATPTTFVGSDDDHTIEVNQNSNFLLNKSITEKVNGELVFHRLYYVMHDYGGEDNFSMFIQLYYLFWLESEFVEKDYTGTGQPLILDYKSNKILGYYSDNKNFSFADENVVVSRTVEKYTDSGTAFIDLSYEEELAVIHLFQPISIPQTDQEGSLKLLSDVVPAFYLKAFEDKNAYANLEKAIWLVIDIISVFTGVGNLMKLRHLANVVKGWKVLKITIAGVELTSGTLGLMLNFVEDCDNAEDDSFCIKLRTYLIYVDLATLGVDSISSKFIRNSANDAYRNMPDVLRKQHPEIADELLTVARRGNLTEESINGIRKFLKQKGYTVEFNLVTIDLLDGNSKFYFRLEKTELETYFNFVSQSKFNIRRQLKDVKTKIKSNKRKYNPVSKTSRIYKVPASSNKLCQNFRGTKYIHSKKADFKIRLTGSRNKDFDECRRIYSERAGLTIDEILGLEDEMYVWHHLDDLDGGLNCTMQLVRKEAHSASHIGSVKLFTELTGIKYKT